MMTIPGGTPAHDDLAPLDTDNDVLSRVDRLISRDARRDRSLWLFFLAADAVQLPVVVPLDDMPAIPDPRGAAALCDMASCVLLDAAPGGSLVITLVRRNGSVTDADQQWAATLRAAAARAGLRLRMICLATRDGVRQLASRQACESARVVTDS
jgi:hypothetical protein